MNRKTILQALKYILGISFILNMLVLIPQKLNAQKNLVIEKPGTVKNIKYEINNRVKFKMVNNTKITGQIQKITDSSLFINHEEFLLKKIKYFYKERFSWRVISTAAFQSGLAYISIDALNNFINNERPVVSKQTLKPGVVLIMVGVLTYPLREKRLNVQEKWRIKILDFDQFNIPNSQIR